MEYLIRLLLSLTVAGLAAMIGFDRERVFCPTVLIAIASYDVLFAVMGASRRTLILEIVVASGFLLVGTLGFKRNLWLVAIALLGHGVFDFVRPGFIFNPPSWWPGFCLIFDVVIGGLLALRLAKHDLAVAG